VFASPPTLLVVDDVAWVRSVLSAGLQRYGFTVLLAENGRQALALYPQTAAIRAVLVDKRLPDMDGAELLAALRQLNPEIQYALMSGETLQSGEEELAGLGKVRVFRKPFHLDEVARVLWHLVGETKSSGFPEAPARE
jgi:CheY-like chemotaxis protein